MKIQPFEAFVRQRDKEDPDRYPETGPQRGLKKFVYDRRMIAYDQCNEDIRDFLKYYGRE